MPDEPSFRDLRAEVAADSIRTAEEQVRVQQRLLTRGNGLGETAANALKILRHGGEVAADELAHLETRLRSWTRDVRAVASEEKP